MKFFYDTEFHEGIKTNFFGKKSHFIDLISIGIVAEDGCEYYAINKECNIKAIWNNEWLKTNVLRSVYSDLISMYSEDVLNGNRPGWSVFSTTDFTLKGMKNLLDWYGKSKSEIADDIQIFTGRIVVEDNVGNGHFVWNEKPELWAYFADYDHVVLCSLFGRMLDLPKSFPMYTLDLKQLMHEYDLSIEWKERVCPGDNEHNALADAKWNLRLYNCIKEEIELDSLIPIGEIHAIITNEFERQFGNNTSNANILIQRIKGAEQLSEYIRSNFKLLKK